MFAQPGQPDDDKILEVDEFANINDRSGETSFAGNKMLRKSTSGYPTGTRPPRSGNPIGNIQIQQKSGQGSAKNAMLQSKTMPSAKNSTGQLFPAAG